jgi:hypothetical protein
MTQIPKVPVTNTQPSHLVTAQERVDEIRADEPLRRTEVPPAELDNVGSETRQR